MPDVRGLGSTVGSAVVTLGIDPRAFTAGLASAKASLLGFAKVAGIASGVLGAAGLVIGIKKVVGAAASFQAGMAMVKSVSNATASEFAALTDKAKELGRATRWSMLEIAQGQENLARLGFSATEIITSIGGVSDLAASQMIELAAAADMTGAALKGMGMDTSEATRVADVFAYAASNSAARVEGLSEALSYAAPLARAAGMSIEQTTALIGKLSDANIRGSRAGTTLRFALAELVGQTDSFKGKLDDLGMSMEDLLDTQGNLKSFAEIIGIFEKRGYDAAELVSLFGKRAGPGMAVLVGVGSKAVAEFTEELENAGGTAQRMAEIQLDTLSGQMTILKGSISLLATTLGESMLPSLQKVVQYGLVPMINRWAEFIERIKPKLTAAFDKVYEYITLNGKALVHFLRGFAAIAKIVGIVLGLKLAFGLLTSPIVILTALAYGLYMAYKFNLLNIQKAVKSLGEFFGITDIEGTIKAIAIAMGVLVSLKLASWIYGIITAMGKFLLAIGPAGWLLLGLITLLGRVIAKWGELKESGFGDWASIIGLPTDAQWAEWAGQLWDGFMSIIPSNEDWAEWGQAILDGIQSALTWALNKLLWPWWAIGISKQTLAPGTTHDLMTGKQAGGLVPGKGMGDTIPALLEPGEFVVPNWMMNIPWLSNLIKGTWSRGKRMRLGGAADDWGTYSASGLGTPGLTGQIVDVLNAIQKWVYGLAIGTVGKAEVIKTFGYLKQLVTGFSALTSESKELIETVESEADAIKKAADELEEAFGGGGDALTKWSERLKSVMDNIVSLIQTNLSKAIHSLLKNLFGLGDAAEDTMSALGVPIGFKAERIRYAAIRPGEPAIGRPGAGAGTFWDDLLKILSDALSSWAITDIIKPILDWAITDIIKPVGDWIWENVLRGPAMWVWDKVLAPAGNFIIGIFSSLWTGLVAVFGVGLASVIAFVVGLGLAIAVFAHLDDIWEMLKGPLTALWNALCRLWEAFRPVIDLLGEIAWVALKVIIWGLVVALTVLAAAVDVIAWVFKAVGNMIIGVINAVIGLINLIPFVNIAKIPYMHKGGILPGPMGSEQLFVGQGGERITPPGMALAGAGGGGREIHVHVEVGSQELAHVVIDELRDMSYTKTGRSYSGVAITGR